jgi:predicted P-loop ATPase
MLVNNDTQKSPQDTTTKLFGDSLNTSECLRKLVDRNVSYKDIPTEIASDLGLKSWDGGPGHLMSGVDPRTGEPWFLGLQFKPDVPWVYTDKNGKKSKPAKYLTASGHGTCPLFADMPDAEFWQKVISDLSTPVVITEGFKKAMVGLAAGYATISISGVDCWREDKELHNLLKLFAIKGRIFYLAFDMDLFTNVRVLSALRALGLALEKEGATVKVMSWDSKHKGLDDYLLDKGLDAIAPIIRDALTLGEWWDKVSDRLLKDFSLIENRLGLRLRYNEMSHQVELDGKPFNMGEAKNILKLHHGVQVQSPRDDIPFLVKEIAAKDTYHPVREYLEKVHTLHGHDTSILDDLASKVLGAHDPLDQIFLKRFLTAAVARAYEPGCKVDTVLILKGAQGVGKSTFFKVLVGPEWFNDSLPPMGTPNMIVTMHHAWLNEWAELEVVFGQKDTSAVKSFITTTTDNVRRPYERSIESLKRSSLLVGTTNQDEFLRDATGNRRFWPVTVGDEIELKYLENHRNEIWAAAVTLYKRGEQWHLTREEEKLAAERVKDYQEVDHWEEPILKYVDAYQFVTVSGILASALEVPTERQDMKAQKRVGKILRANGWEEAQRRVDGHTNPKRGFVRGKRHIDNSF